MAGPHVLLVIVVGHVCVCEQFVIAQETTNGVEGCNGVVVMQEWIILTHVDTGINVQLWNMPIFPNSHSQVIRV
jgi:hypothetical protein